MSRCRVAVLTTSFPLWPGASSGVFVARLMESLARHAAITVVTPAAESAGQPPLPYAFPVKAFRYAPRRWRLLAHQPGGIPVALRGRPWLYLLIPLFLSAMLVSFLREARRAEILHANWAICGLLAGIAGRLLGKPVVTTLRGEDVARLRGVNGWVLRAALRLSTGVVTVSRAFEERLAAEYPGWRDKLRTIPNGVDEEFLAVGKQRAYELRRPVHLLTVGSLIPRKGIDQILTALAELSDRESFCLSIVGDGPLRNALEKLAEKLGIRGQVAFLGSCPPQEVAGLLAQADIFVFASHSEGRPNAVLEAMAAGLPVVAGEIPGVEELVRPGQAGLLFRDGDLEAFSAHLAALVEQAELRAHYGRNAHRFIVEQGLVWESTAQRYLTLFERLLEK